MKLNLNPNTKASVEAVLDQSEAAMRETMRGLSRAQLLAMAQTIVLDSDEEFWKAMNNWRGRKILRTFAQIVFSRLILSSAEVDEIEE